MKLYFLRHGLASHDNWIRPDFERPLNQKGIERMKLTAKCLQKLDLGLEVLLSSPLVRARQTAEIATDGLDPRPVFQLDERLSPGFDLAALETILRDFVGVEALMVVGHEPDFSEVIGDLIGGAQIVVKKGSLARIDLHGLAPPRGSLVWMVPPKLLVQ
jgi:phosphohistidine phosphatase